MNLHEQISRIQEMMGVSNVNKHLEIGKSNNEDEVKDLQKILKIDQTGEFDDETEECVKKFQEFNDIKVDGIVGPETREKLNDNIEGWKGCKDTKIKKPESKSSVKSIGNATLLSGTWKVPSSAPSKADALHSFEKRKSDGVGAKILSQIESKLKELYDKGINPDIYELDIDVDSKNYTVKWSAKIGPSKDGKAYMGLASRGSAGGGADTRAKGQLPKLMNRIKNSGAEDITEFLDFKNSNGIYIRQFFFKYTLPKKYKPH